MEPEKLEITKKYIQKKIRYYFQNSSQRLIIDNDQKMFNSLKIKPYNFPVYLINFITNDVRNESSLKRSRSVCLQINFDKKT